VKLISNVAFLSS